MIYSIKELLDKCHAYQTYENGKWIHVRPTTPCLLHRIKTAWLVLTGKVDGVIWDK